MQIKQLELYGFKSFVDRTVISLTSGICAVVGPNGCGKSNVVDAIRWVLGEQSAKQLRGKVMEEVIFSGANGRPAVNFSEVSLVLANDDGKAPPPYQDCSEIMISRRLFRSGDSEYLINKIPCRRMDITRFFLETGIGHRHYAIIEQGKISTVIESRPEDIRGLIEDAAGITKFKLRKKAALRKIDLTQQNLLRLGDIVGEVSRQVATLQRQAQRADRYRALKRNIKDLEVARALHHYQGWQRDLGELEEQRRHLEDAQAGRSAQLARTELELAEWSVQAHKLEDALQEERQGLIQLKSSIGNDESSLGHLERRIKDLRQRQERLTREMEEQEKRRAETAGEQRRLAEEQHQLEAALREAEVNAGEVTADLGREKTRLSRVEDLLDAGKADLVDLLGDMARVRNQQLGIRKRLEELDHRDRRRRQAMGDAEEERSRLQPRAVELAEQTAATRASVEKAATEAESLRRERQDLETLRAERATAIRTLESKYHEQHSQLKVLEEMESSFAWFSEGVKAIMQAQERGEIQVPIRGVVADLLEVEASYLPAVEAALGDRLQGLLVDSLADGCVAAEHLKRTEAGRSPFVPAALAGTKAVFAAPAEVGPVPLLSLVKPLPGQEGLVHALLDGVLFCHDLQQAVEWWEKHPHALALVTAAGEMIDRGGVLWGGSRTRQISILEKRGERKTLAAFVADLEQTLEGERRALQQAEEALLRNASQLRAVEAKQGELREKLLAQEKEQYRLHGEAQRIRERLILLEMEREQDAGEAAELKEELAQEQENLAALEVRRGDLAAEIEEAQSERQELARLVAELQEKATAHQVTLGTLIERRESVRLSHQRLADYTAENERRLQDLGNERNESSGNLELASQEEQEIREHLDRTYRALLEQESRLKTEEDRWRVFTERQQDFESRRLDLLHGDKKEQQEIQRLHQEMTELTVKLQYLTRQVQERYHVDLAAASEGDSSEPLDLQKMDERIQRLRDQVDRIGEVNLTAIQEYEEQKKRHDFLTAQRDDLVQSLDGLKKAIARINRTTRTRFLRTLETVNRKLGEVFPLLFNGGSGRLQLLDENDPLESGVEILVHPPGKRLTSMSLLSGGEKALAAVALLFSLYLIKPSPFCILDEVDAPLDDANIDRFNEVLKKISKESQVIMVTHNKRSMEISDLLLGVTMEQPGISKVMSVNFKGATDHHDRLV
jgi:chromosome segregation protein